MEPTRTGSFDDELFQKLIDFSKSTPELFSEEYIEQIEKQIADSHDITKSSFGIEDW